MRRCALLVMALLCLVPGLVPGAGAALAAEPGAQALAAVNADRANRGLAPLAPSAALQRAAQAHAEDMMRRRYFDHASPEGLTAKERFLAAGGSSWLAVAENLARCDGCGGDVSASRIARLQAGWMASPEHRDNLLSDGFDRFGFGHARDATGRLYAVQTFAGPGLPLQSAGPAGAPARPVPPAIAADLVNRQLNAVRNEAGRARLAQADVLARAAAALLPGPGEPLVVPDDGFAALPAAARGAWAELYVLAAGCGACGSEITDADLTALVGRWLVRQGARAALLRDGLTHLGLAAAAPEPGRKTLILVAGRRH